MRAIIRFAAFLGAIFVCCAIQLALAREESAPKNRQVLVVDFSGWQSEGIARVNPFKQVVMPEAPVVSVGISPADKADGGYDIVVPAKEAAYDESATQVYSLITKDQTIVHFDINEEGLPNQTRFSLPFMDRVFHPAQVAARVCEKWLKDHPDGTLILRGHSDGTYAVGYVFDYLRTQKMAPETVILESPRQAFGHWAARAKLAPDTLVVSVTSNWDFPRNNPISRGYGRIPCENWVNINIESPAEGQKVGPHSRVWHYDDHFERVRVRGYVNGKKADSVVENARLGDTVEGIVEKERAGRGSPPTYMFWENRPPTEVVVLAEMCKTSVRSRADAKARRALVIGKGRNADLLAEKLAEAGFEVIRQYGRASEENVADCDVVLTMAKDDREKERGDGGGGDDDKRDDGDDHGDKGPDDDGGGGGDDDKRDDGDDHQDKGPDDDGGGGGGRRERGPHDDDGGGGGGPGGPGDSGGNDQGDGGAGHPYTSPTLNFPPPEPWGDVGGVLLCGKAEVEGLSPEDIQEASIDPESGTFSLLIKGKDVQLEGIHLRRFITVLWAVYYGDEDPGVSIDPIAPDAEVMLVRYIGNVIGTELSGIMCVCDYKMKKWAVGVESPGIEGFVSVDDWTAEKGLRYIGAIRRFWFVPKDMRFRKCGDAILFESGRMTVKTEYAFLGDKEARSEPADEAFAEFFTTHYEAIAARHPEYQVLFEYARLVALAKYLKESGVPLHWFLMANRDLILTGETQATVPALTAPSKHYEGLTIYGGVDLGINLQEPGRYIIDEKAADALREAVSSIRSEPESSTTLVSKSHSTLSPGTLTTVSDTDYTIVPATSLIRGGTHGKTFFQTDVALRKGGQPGVELVRYYDPQRAGRGAFGDGWNLLIPYRIQRCDGETRQFLNAIIPERLDVIDLLGSRKESLVFSDSKFEAAGYFPNGEQESRLIGLFIMSDGSFRLLEETGAEFHFDPSGRMTDTLFSPTSFVHYEYEDDRIARIADSAGGEVRLNYEDDRVCSASCAGGSVKYGYDGEHLYSVTGPNGNKTCFLYAPNGDLAETVKPNARARKNSE